MLHVTELLECVFLSKGFLQSEVLGEVALWRGGGNSGAKFLARFGGKFLAKFSGLFCLGHSELKKKLRKSSNIR